MLRKASKCKQALSNKHLQFLQRNNKKTIYTNLYKNLTKKMHLCRKIVIRLFLFVIFATTI